ncbi:MAG TPA: T9SS type A sorting domain-containing protein, partial [Moheibacter sp.]|nr:T9SS type A sorting domain-containing protein [Moheibacter sp.]
GNGDTDVDGGLLISEDGGETWTEKLPGINFDPISFNLENSNEIWLGSSLGGGPDHSEGLYKSTDGGETWNLVPITWTEYILDCINVIKINPENPDNIIVLEENEVAISHDGGDTWTINVYPNAYDTIEDYCYGLNASFNPFNENEVLISSNYYPFFSSDSGNTMTRIKTPYFLSDGNIRYFSNGEEDHLYYGAQFGFVHRNMQTSEDNGYNIMPLNYVSNSPGTTLHIDPKQAGRTFSFSGGFMGSSLKISDDHGATENQIYSVFLNEFNAVASLPDNPNIVWASFSSFGEMVEIQRIDFTDLNNVQASPINIPQAEGRIMNIFFDQTNPDHVVISQGGKIYKSTDGGTSWNDSSTGLESLNPTADLIMKMVKNPLNENQLTLATSGGIFTSIDNGENWEQISPLFAHNISHSTYHDGQMVAIVHNSNASGFALRYTEDGGQTWETVDPSELFYLNSTHVFSSSAIVFGEDLADIYIATSDLGLVKFTLDLTSLSVSEPEFISGQMTTIYPNPATDFVNVAGKEEIEQIEIFNMAGQKILNSSADKIKVSHLTKGIYLVKITLKNGKSETKKLIKK